VGASIFEENDRIAGSNLALLKNNGVFCINVMGSPGSGKTSVLEKTIPLLAEKNIRTGVIEGDIKGSLDGERLTRLGIPVVQINTGGACHLDANMVKRGIEHFRLQELDVLFIENVGNLVCPAEFRLGEHMDVIISSVPEGEEKPLKYPLMFRISEICLLNKSDMVKYAGFDTKTFKEYLFRSAPGIRFLPLSAKTGEGFSEWISFLLERFGVGGGMRIAVVGLGDRMKGDDAAGCEAAELLKREITRDNVKIINAENAVENYLGVIEKFKPEKVFIIDAADFGGRSGDVKILKARQVKETTSSTHNFSLPLIIKHIKAETGAKCILLGIQPGNLSFAEGLSREVKKGVEKAVGMIKNKIAES